MSRQRLRESNVKWQITLTNESLSLKIIKLVELKSIENKSKVVNIIVNQKVKNFIQDNFSENVKFFEKKNKLKINIDHDDNMQPSDYTVSFESKNKKVIEKIENIYKIDKENIINKSKLDKSYKGKKININFKKKRSKKKFFKRKIK